jgi:FtsP/CotA-like multicopper oxidase with cupredoxin domain
MVNAMIKKILILSAILQGAAYAEVSIPEQIKVPSGYSPVLTVHAKGDQIYQCTLNKGEFAWETQAPDAKLFDAQGNIVGNHTAGPLWEYKEGSRVVGRVVNKADVSPGKAISWLLVEVVSHKGDGLFSNVNFINRINTYGGLPPTSRCNANHLGSEKRVAYTADYVFYSK